MTTLTASEQRSEPVTDGTVVRPFRVDVPEAELTELRSRIDAIRWPEPETVTRSNAGRATGDAAGNEVDRGGYFAAWEEPELFAAELRAAFRPLRAEP